MIVNGNYGTLVVDDRTGRVIRYDPMEGKPPEYHDIVAVDLTERRAWYAFHGVTLTEPQPDGDILDFTYKTKAGVVEMAVNDWREMFLSNLSPEE